ncbi:MAG: ATP-binding protein [Comamonadaceae bacterium]|nr:MAG: ATP-binding protein [Comamonadaceae bacterium]
MFRTRPPAYALACVVTWAVLLLVHTGVLWLPQPLAPRLAWAWYLIDLACMLVIGALVLMQLPRALQWRPRRSLRPSPEVQQERQRIARDLHDQVGSQLVNAMALLDGDDATQRAARQALEQCMLDVRCLVDSMDGHDDSLADGLARLRHRIQPVLERRGIRLVWAVEPATHAPLPMGRRAHELTSVVKEAISNVLQHADASLLTVSLAEGLGAAGPEWRLCVVDNGNGLPSQIQAQAAGGLAGLAGLAGQGMASMRERVQRVGATLQVTPAEHGGLSICVVVPLARSRPQLQSQRA